MNTGTKSLLFGVHQVFIHPVVVAIAWCKLYGRPTWRELVCILIHDWGYWGAPNMDGEEGEKHPEYGAKLARLLDEPCLIQGHPQHQRYHDLVLYHSRHYARSHGVEPSRLCWADKLSILYEPWWFYLPRAWASGELWEYRLLALEFVPLVATHREWYAWVQERLAKLAKEQRGDAVPYVNHARPDHTERVDEIWDIHPGAVIDGDKRPPLNGWAPGTYTCICTGCCRAFFGSKRATSCAPCVYGDK